MSSFIKKTPECFDAYEAAVDAAVVSMFVCAGQAIPSGFNTWDSAVREAIDERSADYKRCSNGRWNQSLCYREADLRFMVSLDTASEAYFGCAEQ